MAEFDTTQLLEDVKERGSLPDNDARFTNATLLRAATLELRERLAPMLATSRVEHLVYPYQTAVVSGTAGYRMPPRAVGGTLRNVSFENSAGEPTRLRELSSDEVEQIRRNTPGTTPYGYYLRNYHVQLVPVPSMAGTLLMPYYARPNRLVLPSEAAVVTSVSYNAGSDTLVLQAVAPPATLQSDGTSIEVVRGTPGFETLTEPQEATISEVVPGTFEYLLGSISEDPGVAVGDYICLPGEAAVPQAPVEMHGLLAVRTARRVIKAVGDDRWQALDADVAELQEAVRSWLTQRVAGQTQQAGGSIGSSGIGPFGGGVWGG